MHPFVRLIPTAAAAAIVLAGAAWAAGPADVARLGKDLTPTGGEVAGNKDGTIPVWEGDVAPLPGWTPGKFRGDYWKYKGDKPLFTISAANVDQYAARLAPAQIAKLKSTPGYTMDVYPSHRDCSLPNWVLDNTKAGAAKSKISSDGWSLEDAVLPSVPFPFPKSGIEAMWNYLVRYQGVGNLWRNGHSFLSPRAGSTESVTYRWDQLNYYPWAAKGQHSPNDFGGLVNGTYYGIYEPVALAGQALVARYYFAKDSEPFYYFTGQRRVRRLPTYAYDAPIMGFENQYPSDEMEVFYGSPDRFDWKIIGKKEIYVPYNNFAITDFNAKISDVFGDKFINPKFRRYELHRVWVIEGDVKAGFRHTAPKKVVYLDEDSWVAVMLEDYDGEGKLWRLVESATLPAWEIHSCITAPLTNINDLISGRYVADMVIIGGGQDLGVFADPSEDRRMKDDFFSPENLRTIMER